MTGFIIFVVVMIVVGLINKAKQQSRSGDARERAIQKLDPRIQKLVKDAEGQYLGQPPQGQPAGQPTFPGPPMPYAPPAQYQQPLSGNWLPSYGPPQGHRPPQNNLPTPRADTDTRVRELMGSGNEVAAIRLLCDEQDMGILEAQEYARALVAPPGTTAQPKPATPQAPAPVEDEATRYVGSAAFAESIFDLDREENTWASGWVDTPEPEDRSDIDELWQTVRNPPRPGAQPS